MHGIKQISTDYGTLRLENVLANTNYDVIVIKAQDSGYDNVIDMLFWYSMSTNLICSDGRVEALVLLGAFLSMVKMSNSKLYATLGLADGDTNTHGLCAHERFGFR